MRYYLKGDLLSHFIVEPTPRKDTGCNKEFPFFWFIQNLASFSVK